MAKKSTKKKAKAKLDLTSSNLLTSLAYAVVGVLLIILKGSSIEILMTVFGALLIVAGLVDFFGNNDFFEGIIKVAIGVAIIIFGWALTQLVLFIVGALLIVKGVIDFAKLFKKGLSATLPAIATILVGILLVCSKWLDVLFIVAGVIFIIDAILTLFGKRIVKK